MRYVVIGASAAGISGAKTLRELDKEAEIVLVSKDENVYSRCILHHYISNHRDVEALNFTGKNFFEENNEQGKVYILEFPEFTNIRFLAIKIGENIFAESFEYEQEPF